MTHPTANSPVQGYLRGVRYPYGTRLRRGRATRPPNLVERAINRRKQFRRTATRYAKKAGNYLAMLHIGSILLGGSNLTANQYSEWRSKTWRR